MGAKHSIADQVPSSTGASERLLRLKQYLKKDSSLISKWQTERNQNAQLCAVIRHAERADAIWAYWRGQRWTQTEDFARYQLDPPLSDAGLENAGEIGDQVAAAALELNTSIHVVVTSPYLRCVQTAAEICAKLGGDTRVLVDYSIGEVYGPSVMGDSEPATTHRPRSELLAWCRSRGVRMMSASIGECPKWPEDFRAARRRYAERFLTFLDRGFKAKRNFILVSHADCVGAALTVMPSQVNKVVETVEYGGLFLATCRRDEYENLPKLRRGMTHPMVQKQRSPESAFTAAVPAAPAQTATAFRGMSSLVDKVMAKRKKTKAVHIAPEEDSPRTPNGRRRNSCPSLTTEPRTPRSPCTPHSGDRGAASSKDGAFEKSVEKSSMAWMDDVDCQASKSVGSPKQAEGWTVLVHNVAVVEKPGKKDGNLAFAKKVQQLGRNSKYSVSKIERLLLNMTDKSLGVGDGLDPSQWPVPDEQIQASPSQTSGPMVRSVTTHMSLSTYLFGMSDVGMSDIGSDDGGDGCMSRQLSPGHEGELSSSPADIKTLIQRAASDRKTRTSQSLTSASTCRPSKSLPTSQEKRQRRCRSAMECVKSEKAAERVKALLAIEKVATPDRVPWMRSVPSGEELSQEYSLLPEVGLLPGANCSWQTTPNYKASQDTIVSPPKGAAAAGEVSSGSKPARAAGEHVVPDMAKLLAATDRICIDSKSQTPSAETGTASTDATATASPAASRPPESPKTVALRDPGESLLMRRRSVQQLKLTLSPMAGSA